MGKLFRIRKRFVILIAVLVLILPVGWLFENRRGNSAWDEVQARAGEAGVSLIRADYAGPDIPDHENLLNEPLFSSEFFRTREPALKPWYQLPGVADLASFAFMNPATGKVVEYAGFFEGSLSEDVARERLKKMAYDYEIRLDELREVIWEKPVHPLLKRERATSHLVNSESQSGDAIGMARCYQSSGLMALRSGDARRALETFKTLERINGMIGDPSFIGYLMFLAIGEMNLHLIWEGARLRSWTEDEMAELSTLIAKRDLKVKLLESLEFQAAYGVEGYDTTNMFDEVLEDGSAIEDHVKHWIRNRGPAGWRQQRKTLKVASFLDARKAFESEDREALEKIIEKLPKGEWEPIGATSKQTSFALSHLSSKYWRSKTKSRIALIALAAESYYRTHQEYPQTLGQMKLDFPVIDLTDTKNRELSYRLGPDGRPEIESLHEKENAESKSNRRLRWQFWSK